MAWIRSPALLDRGRARHPKIVNGTASETSKGLWPGHLPQGIDLAGLTSVRARDGPRSTIALATASASSPPDELDHSRPVVAPPG